MFKLTALSNITQKLAGIFGYIAADPDPAPTAAAARKSAGAGMRRWRKLGAVISLAAMLFSVVCPTASYAAGIKSVTSLTDGNGDGNSGDFIYYGNYWQNNASGYTPTSTSYQNPEEFNKNNYDYSSVKWRVLSNSSTTTAGTGTGVLILSDQGLYSGQFADSNSWGSATNSARTTLQNTTATTFNSDGTVASWGGFAGDAFSSAELGAIANTSNEDTGTTDTLFLLSKSEAMNNSYGFNTTGGSTATRHMTATTLAKNAAMYNSTQSAYVATNGVSYWWLRSTGLGSNSSQITYYGNVNEGSEPDNPARVPRMAFNLDTDSVLFVSAAAGGKSAVAAGDSFALADYTGTDYKLTVHDTTMSDLAGVNFSAASNADAVAAIITAASSNTSFDLTDGYGTGDVHGFTVNYSGKDANADYVSAIIKDSEGNILNYAKVSSSTNGSAYVSTGSLANGDYTVQFFSEKTNGDYETDYASNLSTGYSLNIGEEGAKAYTGTLAAGRAGNTQTFKLGSGFQMDIENANYPSTEIDVTSTGALIRATGASIGRLQVEGDTIIKGSMKVTDLTRTAGTVTVDGTLTSNNMNAVGSNNRLSAIGTTATGADNTISGANSTATGTGNTISGENSQATGNNNIVSGANSTATGTGINLSGTNSVAFGTGHNVSGCNSGAFGDPNNVSGNNSYAIGNNNTISGDNTFVLGNNVNTGAAQAIGIGNNATVGANYAIAIGDTANASAEYSVALGSGANASISNSVALGSGANASLSNSVALGAGSDAAALSTVIGGAFKTTGWAANKSAVGVVSVGKSGAERQITNVAAGSVSATSTDAINGSQFYSELIVDNTGTYNYIHGSQTNTTGENIIALDAAMGKQAANGKIIKANDSTNTLATNIALLDTAIGDRTYAHQAGAGGYLTNDQAIGTSLNALNDNMIKGLSVNAGGKIVATQVDSTTIESTNAISDYRVTAGSYDATNKKITLTTTDKYGSATETVNITGLDTTRVVAADSGTAQTLAAGRTTTVAGANTASTSTKNITTTVTGASGNATVAIGLADNISVNNVTAKAEVKGATLNATSKVVVGTSSLDTSTLKVADGATLTGTQLTIGDAGLNSSALTVGTNAGSKAVVKDGLISVGSSANLSSSKLTVGSSSLNTSTLNVGGYNYITASGIAANSQKITSVGAGTADTDAVNYGQLKAGTTVSGKHNYYDGSSTAVAVGTALNAVDSALGKTAAGNYITASDAAGTNTVAAQVGKLDTAIGTWTPLSGEGKATSLVAYDKNNAATTSLGKNLEKLDAYGIQSYSTLNGKITAKRNDATTVDVAQMQDYRVTSGSYNKTENQIELTMADAYGVATGTKVNVSLTGLGTSQNYTADEGGNVTVDSDHQLKIAGGKNVNTSITGTNSNASISVALKDDIAVSTVVAGIADGANTNISSAGVKVTDSSSNVATLTGTQLTVGTSSLTTDTLNVGGYSYITTSGISANNTKITKVGAGTEGTDAVNFGQLENYSTVKINNDATNLNTGSGIVLKAGDNATVTASGNEITIAATGSSANYSADDSEVKTVDSTHTLSVKGGATDTTNANNITTAITQTTEKEDATITVTLAKDLNVSSVTATAVNSSTVNASTSVKVGTNTTVTDGDITVGTNVSLNGTNGLKVGSNVSLNSSQLTVGSSSLNTSTLNVGGHDYITSAGIDANSKKITSVGAGDVTSSSTDAVNGTQLYGYSAVKVTAKDATVLASNLTNSSGIEIAAGDNICLSASGNKLTITSLGGSDTQAVHYDYDATAHTGSNSVTLKDNNNKTAEDDGGYAVAIKNVATAGTLSSTNSNASTGADVYNATTMSADGNYYAQGDSVTTALGKVDVVVKGNNTNISTLQGYFTEGKANYAIADGAGNNISDTYATKTELGAAGKITVGGATGTTVNTSAGTNFNGSSNITLSGTPGNVDIVLKNDIAVSTVVAGIADGANTNISSAGVKVTDSSSNVATLTGSELNVSGATLNSSKLAVGNTAVTSGNVDLGNNVSLNATNGLQVGATTNLTSTKLTIGDDATLTADTLTIGTSSLNTSTLNVGGYEYITASGIAANNQKITAVGAGTEGTDAVNFGQMQNYSTVKINNDATNLNTGSGIVLKAGDNATVTASGNEITIAATGSSANYSADNSEVKTVDSTHTLSVKGGATDTTNANNITTAITQTTDKEDATITVTLAKDLNVSSVTATAVNSSTVNASTSVKVGTNTTVTDGDITVGTNVSLNASNGLKVGDGYTFDGTNGLKVGTNVALNSSQLTVGSSSLNTSTLNVGGYNYITASGISANNTKITNVGAGDVTSSSTDAVNGTQLYGYSTVKVTAKDASVLTSNLTNSSGIEIVAGDNISLSTTDNKLTITSLGGSDTQAVHYDYDATAHTGSNSVTLKDNNNKTAEDDGGYAVAIKNVATAGTLSSTNSNASTGADVYNATTMSADGNYYAQGDSVTTALGKVDVVVKGNNTNISTLQGYFTDGKANKAIADGAGNNISDTYAKSTDVAETYATKAAVGTVTDGSYVSSGSTIGANINALDTQVAANTTAIGTKANQSDLTAHASDTTAHITADERTAWNAYDARITGNATNISTLNTTVTGINSNVSTLQGYFNEDGKALKAVNADYATAAGNATNDSEGNKISTTYAKSADVYTKTEAGNTFAAKSIETNVSTLEGYFDAGGIAKKATADAYGNDINSTYAKSADVAATYATKTALSGEATAREAADKVKVTNGATVVDNINSGSGIEIIAGTNINLSTDGNKLTINGVAGEGIDTKAVHYTTGTATNDTIALTGVDGTTISNVKAQTLAENGTYAATTGQVYSATTMSAAGNYYEASDSVTTALGKVDTQVNTNATDIANITNGTTTVGNATNATQDGSGNVISTTYATKSELSTHTGDTVAHITADERTAWNAKQNALSEAQLAAVDSGITAADKTKWNNYETSFSTDTLTTTGNVTFGGNMSVTGTSTFTGLATFSAGASMGGQKITNVANGSADTDAATVGQMNTAISTAVSGKADAATTYTKTEVDSALAAKADAATTYTKTEVDSALAAKADTTYVDTKAASAETNAKSYTDTQISAEATARDAAISSAVSGKADAAATAVYVNSTNVNSGSGVEFVAGSNVTISADATKGTITIASTGGGSGSDIADYTGTNELTFKDQSGSKESGKIVLKNVEVYGLSSGAAANASDTQATATGAGAVATGYNSNAAGDQSVASGYNSAVSKPSTAGIAIGNGATVGYTEGKISNESVEVAVNSIGIGVNATVTGSNSIAVGTGNVVTGSGSGAFGDPSYINADNAYGIGNNNSIGENATGSFILGNESVVTGADTFVIGSNVTTAANNSVVLGSGSTATEDYEVSVGNASRGLTRKITNVTRGTISATSTDAVTGSQLYETNMQLAETSKEVKEVGAMSAALAGLHYVEPTGEGDDKFTGAVAYGGYRGESAAAIGIAYKPNSNLMISASTSIGNNQNMYNAGVGFKFGKGNTAATRATLQKQVKYLNDKNGELADRLDNANTKIEQQNTKIEQQDTKIEQLMNAVENLKKLIKK